MPLINHSLNDVSGVRDGLGAEVSLTQGGAPAIPHNISSLFFIFFKNFSVTICQISSVGFFC